MTGAVLSALWSHWRRHPLQLATLLAGVALATALWSAVQAINAEARASYARANEQLATGQLPELRAPAGSIALGRYVELRRAGWQLAAVLEGNLRAGGRTLAVQGVDLLTYPALPALAGEGAAGIDTADLLTAPGIVFAAPPDAGDLDDLPVPVRVVESDGVPAGTLLTDIGTAEALLGRPGRITRLLVLPDQPPGLPPLDELAPDLQRIAPEAAADATRLSDSFELNLTAFGLLSFAVGLFIAHGAAGLAFVQRRGMIRTLRALGVPLALLSRLMLAELLILALAGGTAGLVLGYLVAAALLPDVAAALHGLYGASVDGGLSLRPAWLLSGLGMAVAGTLAAGAQALWRLMRLPLLSAPGQRAWGAGGQPLRRQALCGAALIFGGALAGAAGEGLIAGFAMLGGLMTGAALLLPPALSVCLGLAERRARAPLWQWLWADMRAQLPGLSLALMALLLALAANVGVSTMVSSFRLTFTGWLDQRLASELYVTARDDRQGAEIAAWLRPRTAAVLPIRSVELRRAGRPLFLYGVVDHPTYRANWPLLAAQDGAWDAVAGGDAILINEQMARRDGLWTGDDVTLMPGWSLPVAGVYSDYGNPTGQAIVALGALLGRVPDVPDRRFGIRLPPGEAPALAQALRARFDLPPHAVVSQAALKQQSLAIFDQTFLVTGALNVLTLGVAGFAMLTSLLTLWTQRLPQLAPVWALGLTRARLARLELLRSLALAAMTAVLALPLGLLLAWMLLAVINVEAFGWRLPMYLFPGDWLRLLGLALLAAVLAAALPVRRLRRIAPADLLRVFADER